MRALLALTCALLLLPAASAELTLETTFAGGEIPTGQPIQAAVNISLDCTTILSTLGGTVTLAPAELPEWLTATSEPIEFSAADCAADPMGVAAGVVTVTLATTETAPGLLSIEPKLKATYTPMTGDGAAADSTLAPVFAAYRPGHTVTPSGDQTFQVSGSTPFTFDMQIEVTANARTMVMFEDKVVSNQNALVNGIKAHIYDVPNGETKETRKVLFTPPSGAWDQVTVQFRNYSHCLDGTECGNQLERIITWTFVNSNPQAAEPQQADQSPSKGAPSLPLIGVLASLVAVALVLRRE